jgi:hypothetical protein
MGFGRDFDRIRKIMNDLNRSGIPEMMRQANALRRQGAFSVPDPQMQETLRNVVQMNDLRRRALRDNPPKVDMNTLRTIAHMNNSVSSQQELAEVARVHADMQRQLNPETLRAAQRVANSALARAPESARQAMDAIEAGRIADLVREAVRVVSSPEAEALLQQANEATFEESTAEPPEEIVTPEAEADTVEEAQILQLDRQSLIWLVGFLMRLFNTLAVLLGLAAVTEDSQLTREDLERLLYAVGWALDLAMRALKKKNEEE